MTVSKSLLLIVLYIALALLIRMRFRNRATAVLMVIVLTASTGLLIRDFRHEIRHAFAAARLLGNTPAPSRPDWPPRLHEPYPDLTLVDQDGRPTKLSSFKGKVILLEPVGIPCPACVAFSGGHLFGPFRGVAPQPNLERIDTYLRRFGGVDLNDSRLVFVQILLFDDHLSPPSADDAREWARHFRLERSQNHIVLAGSAELCNPASRQMIPGFQLIDQNFILRADSTGTFPRDNLYSELLPMARRLMEQQ